MDYKYLKYKKKYINLKNNNEQEGGLFGNSHYEFIKTGNVKALSTNTVAPQLQKILEKLKQKTEESKTETKTQLKKILEKLKQKTEETKTQQPKTVGGLVTLV